MGPKGCSKRFSVCLKNVNSPLNKGYLSINNSFDLPKVSLIEKFGVSLYKYGAEPNVSLRCSLFGVSSQISLWLQYRPDVVEVVDGA